MKKHLTLFLLIINLTFFFFSIFWSIKIIRAQSITPTQNAITNAKPTPHVPCNETRENTNLFTSNYPISEFHSLRPYQASPCIENTPQSQMALYCGNDIVLEDSGEILFQFDTGIFKLFPHNASVSPNINPESCEQNTREGTQVCTFLIRRDRNISINLSGLDLPVLGNTQNVRNSYKRTFKEEIDHAQKVNNYLIWYLSGVTYKPEYFYPFPNLVDYTTGLLFEKTDSFKKIIDYSGPLNKMLPQRIQYLARERQINAAVQATSGNTTNNSEDSFSPPTPRHNQVVICSLGINLGTLGLRIGIIENVPVPCNLITTGDNFWNSFLNVVGPIQQRGLRIGYWAIDKRKPPKEEDYIAENSENANQKFMDYVIATNRWRGQICLQIKFPSTGEPFSQIVPSFLQGLGFYLCYDNPNNITQFEPNVQEHGAIDDEFFQHIPMSSTEDRIGEYTLQVSRDMIEQEENVQIESRVLRGKTSSILYLPHLQQSEELSEILQSTYVPYDLAKNSPALEKDVFRDVFLSGNTDVANNNFGSCQALEYRDGPLGDNVFADSFNTTFSYQAKVTCNFPLPLEDPTPSCSTLFQDRCGEMGIDCNNITSLTCAPPGYRCRTVIDIDGENSSCNYGYICGINCEPNTENLSCKFTTSHVIDVNTSSPLLDSIWARIVAGPTSILRRMLPKLGEDSIITQFWDMPGASYASYFSSDEGVRLMMSDFRSNIDPSKAHVYFPHLGGIYHYFLEGLQKSLRPEGFGGKFLSPASTSSIRNPIPITICSQENSQNNQQEPSGNQVTREEILQLVLNYRLPLPNPEDSKIEGRLIRGYNTLFNRLNNDTNAKKSTSELLKAEQELKNSYSSIRRYLTTAWIWYETGSSYWPDPYLYNCDDGENSPTQEQKLDYAWSISRFCALDQNIQQGQNPDFLIQVAGFQATERRKKYRDAFIALYGNDNEKLREILRQVVINSNISTRPSYWSYNHSNQNKGLVQEFLGSLNPNSPNPVTLNDILIEGRIWNSTDNQTETRRKQFFTFMLSKDPKMAIYLNTNGYGGGVTDGSIVSSNYGKQLLSNMIYALWMFESNLGTVANIPTEGSSPIRQIEDICLEKSESIPVDISIKDPIVSANDISVYLSYNYNNSQAILKTKPVKNLSFDNNTINVGFGGGSAPDFLTTYTYLGNGNIYYVWTDQSNPRKILFKKAPLSNVNSITNVNTVTVANSTTGLINHPRIVSNGKFLVVVWNEADDNALANFVRYSFSEDDGQTWSSSAKASPHRIYGKEKPDLATSKDGDISLVYGGAINSNKNIGDIIMLTFNEQTKSFDLELPVALGKGGAFDYADPNHVYTSNGKIFVAFRDIGFIGEKTISRIYVASKNKEAPSNAWKIETISDSTNVWGKPSISTDTLGGIHVFWASGYEQTVFYTYKHPTASWSRVYKIPEQYFVANADNSASVTDSEIMVHGIVEEHNQTSKPKYYIIKVKK